MSKKREELLRELELENRRSNVEGLSYLQAVAERSGMNLTDLQCINILALTGPISAGQLGEEMGLTTGAITGVVNRLEKSGYVRREKDPGDARRVVIQPVSEELERMGAVYSGSREKRALNALFSDYDDRDLAIFLEVVRNSNAAKREETARIRATSEGGEGGEFSAPLDSVDSGRLVFASGASRLTLRAASEMDDLYWARFEGAPPKVEVEGGTVTFRYSRRFQLFGDWRKHSEEVTLNAAIPWEVEVRGGAARTEADLTGLELSSFVLKSGTSNLTLALPEPSGVVPVRLLGGASKVSIRRPTGTEARLTMKGGASELTFGEQSFDALGGKVRLQSPGYEGASDRYEIEVSGGASELTVQ
jgi:DNA-binding MarR family transcriptional regulator